MIHVYDRSPADVSRAAALIAKIRDVSFDGLEAEEKAEWLAGMKAAQNFSDWNRQNANIEETATGTLPRLGYDNFPHTHIPEACASDVPTLDGVNTLEGNLYAIETCGLTMPPGWGASTVWPAGAGPTYADWNRWERNIALLEEMARRMEAAFLFSGEIYAGEV